MVHAHPYRAGPHARKAEEEEVQRMLEADVIEPSQSEWASPVVLVTKPDGILRFCIDYRKVNALTVKDTYPLPRMDEFLDSLGDATIFSTLDCNSGYWQIPMAEDNRDKTTFTCHAGTYRFVRMAFRLCNAPATFRRTADIILMKFRWKTCLVYLDDIIIFPKSIEEHIQYVDEILEKLRNAGMSLKLKHCHFFVKSAEYLGDVIRPGILEVASHNVKAIEQAQPPLKKAQVRSFLGMCNAYRRFVKKFAKIGAPLVKLTSNEAPEKQQQLNDEQIESFTLLMEALISNPILRLTREGLPYSADTDALDGQIGCALFQTYEDRKRYLIGY